MTPFEQGYKAFLEGWTKEMNPFDGDTCPYSRKRWDCGWTKAQTDKRAKR